MANINDYLLWRGDIPISKKYPFNEIDSMILARFSYLRFDKIKMEKTETIGSISFKMKHLKNEEFLYNGDKELITYLGESKRFQNMQITNYVKNNDKKLEKQFGAITIHVSMHEMYLSFIGTDSTIYGWKEDFNMAFMDSVPCQIAGKEYFEKVVNQYPFKKVRMGGHSKGGNVAIYAAITASAKLQKRIIKVYNYDGPGFSKDIIQKYGDEKVIHKIETYLPQDSIIGRIMTHKEKTSVTYSIEKGILQHDIYSWQVLKDNRIELKANTEESENFSQTVADWLDSTTQEQRKIFFNAVFELIDATEATTLSDISKSLTSSLPKILKRFQELPHEERKTITEMIKLLIETYKNVAIENRKMKKN